MFLGCGHNNNNNNNNEHDRNLHSECLLFQFILNSWDKPGRWWNPLCWYPPTSEWSGCCSEGRHVLPVPSGSVTCSDEESVPVLSLHSPDSHTHTASVSTAVTTTPHPTFAWRWLQRHTGACICRQPRQLLCRSTGWCPEEDDRQSCNASSTQLRESYRTAPSTTEDWPRSGATLYTGLTSPTGSSSGCASKCINVSTAWLLDIWPSSADLSPTSMVTGICDLLTARCSASQTINIRRTHILLCWTFSL